jgi:hypothetical protein
MLAGDVLVRLARGVLIGLQTGNINQKTTMKTRCELTEHTGDQVDSHGRCLGECRECGEHLESTGRYTVYCPGCDTCPDCGCPRVDGFEHYEGCPVTRIESTVTADDGGFAG